MEDAINDDSKSVHVEVSEPSEEQKVSSMAESFIFEFIFVSENAFN